MVDSNGPRNDWSREALFNSRSVCSVMGEDSIRGKLGNSRIGVAITADIRPLNHLAVKRYSCPIRPRCPCLAASSISPPRALVFETLSGRKKLNQSACSQQTPGLAVDISSLNLSAPKHTERRTHYSHRLDGGLVLLILRGGGASAQILTRSSLRDCPVVCVCGSECMMCKCVPVRQIDSYQMSHVSFLRGLLKYLVMLH